MSDIDKAFMAVPRINFLPVEKKPFHDIDAPIVIGYGQTNSQPSTVRTMLQWLNPKWGDKILDVGSGSGWTTALLANLVGSTGEVFAVERIPQLVMFGDNNCKQMHIDNVRFFKSGDIIGLPDFEPYDRILVSAAATELPKALLRQLAVGGRMVIPIKTSVFIIDKQNKNNYSAMEHPGFIFVPLL
jgi:protein-L-isoaspartate(D-aspartate) O-methyltransferase